MIKIGNLEIKKGASLAPMAGLTDASQRKIAAEYGAAFTVSEMVSAKALCYNDEKTYALCRKSDGEKVYGIQLFGCEPDCFGEAAKIIMRRKPDFIDINMGCPAPKITAGGNGCALMKNPSLAAECVAAAVKAVDVPVTVKMRTGWDEAHINCAELAMRCEAAGAAAICVHGRTKTQMYTPPVFWQPVAEAKKAVKIPVIANGDITTAADALRAAEQTGCDMVAVGRGAIGNPWLFGEIYAAFNNLPTPDAPSFADKMALLKQNVYDMCCKKGEELAMREARTLAPYYLKGVKGAAHLRFLSNSLTYYTDIENLCAEALRQN